MSIGKWINDDPVTFSVIAALIIFLVLLVIFLSIFLKIVKSRSKKIQTSLEKLASSQPTSHLDNTTELRSVKSQALRELEDSKEYNVELQQAKEQYLKAAKNMNRATELQIENLSKITNIPIPEAKKLLLENIYKSMRTSLSQIYNEEKQEFDKNFNEYAQQKLINAMERMAEATVRQRSLAVIPIEDENMKGRIIGKNGRNKYIFETLTGTEMIVDKKMEISISSVNPIRRQIAIDLFNAMMRSKVIEPSKLENLYEVVKNDFEASLVQYGRDALEEQLKIFDVDPRIYPYVGRLKFRSSFGQNVLMHCIESARYAEALAVQLGIDAEKAKRAAFFHDIGKAQDFDENYDHVETGLKIAKQFNLPEYICNAIESHHNSVEPNSVYAALVKVVDTLSAARPGVRIDSLQDFVERVSNLEKMCKEIPGVKEAYALQSGRLLRVIVQPDIINEDSLDLLQHEIRSAIEANDLTNKHQIKVLMIRETRTEFLVNQKTAPYVMDDKAQTIFM